jgi:Family of unknown function (DUF6866) N-terminal domain/Family of unknown function (DUF6866) C-terminal domain
MFQIDDIADQVLANCNIADSRHAGLYSICGLALRLRDLYKWENRLDPWIENDPSEVLKWIGDKEEAWEELAEKEFKDIRLVGRRFDPFDVKGINEILEPYGFIYGGGYARSLKPSFFLAALEAKKEINHIAVFILGREFARDLLTIPALSQDNCIYIRKESARLFLWDQIFYVKKSGRYALKFGLKDYGLKEATAEDLHRNLSVIAANETDTYIYHELGEIRDAVFDRKTWQEIIASFPHTPIELLTRTVKDLLADTGKSGTLPHIVSERKTASLAFYVAFLEGFTKVLFPQIVDAFQNFTQNRDWELIENVVAEGYQNAKSSAEAIIGIYRSGREKNDMEWVKNEIAKRFTSCFQR